MPRRASMYRAMTAFRRGLAVTVFVGLVLAGGGALAGIVWHGISVQLFGGKFADVVNPGAVATVGGSVIACVGLAGSVVAAVRAARSEHRQAVARTVSVALFREHYQ